MNQLERTAPMYTIFRAITVSLVSLVLVACSTTGIQEPIAPNAPAPMLELEFRAFCPPSPEESEDEEKLRLPEFPILETRPPGVLIGAYSPRGDPNDFVETQLVKNDEEQCSFTARGPDVSLLISLAKSMELEPRIVFMELDRLLDALEAGTVDVAIGGFTNGRSKSERGVVFSPPYLDEPLWIIGEKHHRSHDELRGQRFATIKGSSYEEYGAALTDKVIFVDFVKDFGLSIEQGLADFALVAGGEEVPKSFPNLVVTPFEQLRFQVGFGFHQSRTDLEDPIEKFFTSEQACSMIRDYYPAGICPEG